MTQEDKQLLLVDLCARLPYRVIIDPVDCGKAILIGIKDGNLLLWDTIQKKKYDKPWDIEYIKPYLRPMSSMTEEEKKEFINATDGELRYSEVFDVIKPMRESEDYCASFVSYLKSIDWLNAHHFDYRSFIERGLAIEALEGMYN